VTDEMLVPIHHEADIVVARQTGRDLAGKVGFLGSDLTLIATAISEISRNIVTYAERGEMAFSLVEDGQRRGICIIGRDHGPGIADVEQAMRDGFSTGRSLGLGLPGAKRLMDDFEIESVPGQGTTVIMKKWKR